MNGRKGWAAIGMRTANIATDGEGGEEASESAAERNASTRSRSALLHLSRSPGRMIGVSWTKFANLKISSKIQVEGEEEATN